MPLNWPDTFSVAEMTAAVNKLPLTVTPVSGMFESRGIRTTHLSFDLRQGRIVLIADQPRGSQPDYVTGQTEKRSVKVLTTAHLAQADTLSPEDIQDVREFGGENLMTAERAVNDKLLSLKRNLDMTLEFHRLGAVKGLVLDADGSTVLHDIYKTFEVRQTKLDLKFPATWQDNENPVLTGIMGAKRRIEAAMGGSPFNGIGAILGSSAYDMLTSHRLVREAYNLWAANQANFGNDDYRRRGFMYGGIRWIEASSVVGGRKLVDDDKAHLFPTGPGIWKMFYAPADWMETANTLGRDYYARMDAKDRGRGYDVEVQSNPLTLCMYPEALIELTFKGV